MSGVECLKKFLPIIQRLAEEDGMSSDERDAGNDRRLYSTPPFWRDSSITDWLHSIDSIGSRSANSTKRVQVERLRTSEVDMGSQVVKGLPVNFYSKCYLDTLDEFQYLDLDPKSAASLELNDSVEWWVARFLLILFLAHPRPFRLAKISMDSFEVLATRTILIVRIVSGKWMSSIILIRGPGINILSYQAPCPGYVNRKRHGVASGSWH